MRILLIHQNFPGQFKHLAPALVKAGHHVVGMPLQDTKAKQWNGVQLAPYTVARSSSPNLHPWAADFETKTIRAEACYLNALNLKATGFEPDVILAHPGWGESWFLKEVWPKAKLALYCEFYYRVEGADVNFDPEFPTADVGWECKLLLRNAPNLFQFESADAGISPTEWQASTYPERFRDKISVIHDGIDTNAVAPEPNAYMILNGDIRLGKEDEVITFINRNLEPTRGYHIFMRALPEIMKRRPKARVLIVGGDGLSYGSAAESGLSWKEIFAREVRPQIPDEDWSRIHFLGKIQYEHFVTMLQISTVHVYLTYPFVLSWSLLEAMSAGCAILASDTKPLHEAITHDVTGRLFNFFDVHALSEGVCTLLDDPAARERLGKAAREFARQHYDLKTICLPRQMAWLESLIDQEKGTP